MNSTLSNQEYKATKLFLYLFYTIVLYDVIYYYILPFFDLIDHGAGFPNGGLGYMFHIILIGLLPITIRLIKKHKTSSVKYLYFIVYTLINIINESLLYVNSDVEYSTVNVFEIVFVFLAPIFVNTTFFWTVSLGNIVKFLIICLVIQDSVVMISVFLSLIFSIAAFILLRRFQGYVKAIEGSYEKRMDGIVRGVVATLELKDPFTRGHSERVAHYSVLLAKEMNILSEDELKDFTYACLLHDVGKVHIPDHILAKPSRLTDEEYEVVKTHPLVGAEAIKEIEGLQNSIDVVKHHHECWDGTGYPDQLKGTDIPLLARITAIADVFDAMTSFRSYRPALSPEAAYDIIVAGKGTQFDPKLVEIFKKVYHTWVEFYKDNRQKIEEQEDLIVETALTYEKEEKNDGTT